MKVDIRRAARLLGIVVTMVGLGWSGVNLLFFWSQTRSGPALPAFVVSSNLLAWLAREEYRGYKRRPRGGDGGICGSSK